VLIVYRARMVRTRTILAVVLPLAAACGGDPAPPPAPPTPPVVEPPPPPPPPPATASAPPPPEAPWNTIADWASLPPLHAAKPEDKKIIALASDIKKAHKECATATGVITSDTPSPGAFTAKGAKEVAYVVEYDCNPKGTKTRNHDLVFHKLLVVGGDKGDKLTREVDIPEKRIVGVSDVDADGDNELVLATGKSTKIEARLVELADAPAGQLAPIFAWSDLGDSECIEGQQDVPKILYRMTDSPEYKAEHAKRICTAPAPTAPPQPKK
jgi:hypothetical protein